MTWLLLSLTAFVGFGLQNFLYKVAASMQLNSRTVTFYFILISTTALWILLLASNTSLHFSSTVIILAVLDALLFYTTTLTRLEALKFIPVHLAFPLMRTSTLLVAICGIIFFDESFSWNLLFAVAFLLLAAYLISAERNEDKAISANYRLGLLLTGIALLTSAGTNIVTKIAADTTTLLDYMTLANSLIIILSFIEIRVVTGATIRLPNRAELVVSFWLAVTNLIAWFAYLYALKIGPLSTTAVIAGMGFILPIVLTTIFYKEHLTHKRILAIACTVVTIILVANT